MKTISNLFLSIILIVPLLPSIAKADTTITMSNTSGAAVYNAQYQGQLLLGRGSGSGVGVGLGKGHAHTHGGFFFFGSGAHAGGLGMGRGFGSGGVLLSGSQFQVQQSAAVGTSNGSLVISP